MRFYEILNLIEQKRAKKSRKEQKRAKMSKNEQSAWAGAKISKNEQSA